MTETHTLNLGESEPASHAIPIKHHIFVAMKGGG